MRNSILIFTIIMWVTQSAITQQWVDKQYSYTSELDIQYGTAINFYGDEETLDMDIYLPTCDDPSENTKWPLLMWIHGGAFIAGDKNDVSIQSLCREYAKRGYVTASIDYRLGFSSDDQNWQCNYPNYSCVFAADSSEWSRASYRAIQDGKGALRYLINRHEEYKIDTDNVFIAGESAGAFIALGVGLMDTIIERPSHTYLLPDVPSPHPSTHNCEHNTSVDFNGDPISRPDLGNIDGDIEPSDIDYTIKGIGNMFGGMMSNLLEHIPSEKHKPAIYSYHQPCDIVVPIDSNVVYWGLSWCFTNGYNCYGVANNEIMLYGSRAFSQWNDNHNYGYNIHNDFTSKTFPYTFGFFWEETEGSCLDQVNNPCHAYDNKALREENLAVFFSEQITSNSICDTSMTTAVQNIESHDFKIYPNPSDDFITISGKPLSNIASISIYSMKGEVVYTLTDLNEDTINIDLAHFASGLYMVQLKGKDGAVANIKFIKR